MLVYQRVYKTPNFLLILFPQDDGFHGGVHPNRQNFNNNPLPMTDPNGAAIYGVPWIPSISPFYVSIHIPAPWIRHGLFNCVVLSDNDS